MTEAEESSSVCCSAIVVRALFNTVSTFKRAFLSCLRAPHSNFSALTVLLAVRASLTAATRSAGRTIGERRKEQILQPKDSKSLLMCNRTYSFAVEHY